jgi:hypothetical protein
MAWVLHPARLRARLHFIMTQSCHQNICETETHTLIDKHVQVLARVYLGRESLLPVTVWSRGHYFATTHVRMRK